MDRGPETWVTEGVSLSALDFVGWVGRRAREEDRGSRTLVDGLIESGVLGLVSELFVAAFASANKTFKGLID